eukprot:365530-Chlamydomonas_euryale.AAC.28
MAAATQRVLVTGANKGIGLAICTKLLDDHPSCHVLMGSRDASRGAAALKSLEEAKPGRKGRVSLLEIDVTSKASITKAAADVQKQGALLHGLINNAGIAFGPMPDVLAVNVYGAHDTTDAFLPLIDPANGRVVTISSAAAPNFVEKVHGMVDMGAGVCACAPWASRVHALHGPRVCMHSTGLACACTPRASRVHALHGPRMCMHSTGLARACAPRASHVHALHGPRLCMHSTGLVHACNMQTGLVDAVNACTMHTELVDAANACMETVATAACMHACSTFGEQCKGKMEGCCCLCVDASVSPPCMPQRVGKKPTQAGHGLCTGALVAPHGSPPPQHVLTLHRMAARLPNVL